MSSSLESSLSRTDNDSDDGSNIIASHNEIDITHNFNLRDT